MKQYILCLLSVFLLAVVPSQAQERANNEKYPLLGYFRFGMSYSDFEDQLWKLSDASAVDDNTLTNHFIGIGGVNFDVSSLSDFLEFGWHYYEDYSSDFDLTFFSGNTVFVPDTIIDTENQGLILAALAIKTPYTENLNGAYDGIPTDDKRLRVVNVNLHNKLVGIVDSLKDKLCVRFGTPSKTYSISLYKESSIRESQVSTFSILPTIFANSSFTLHYIYDFIPKCIWVDDNKEIILGIESDSRISLTFVDRHLLSHSYLDTIFVKKTLPKATLEW